MIWTWVTLAVLALLFVGAVRWVYNVFLKNPDGPRALIRLLKEDASSPSFGFWVWWAGSSRLADMTLPLSHPLPLGTAIRGIPKDQKEATACGLEVVGRYSKEVREELSESFCEAMRQASKVMGQGVRLAGGAVRATFEVRDSGDPLLWRGLEELSQLREALDVDPLDPRGAEIYWDQLNKGFPRDWVETAVEVSRRLRPLWERAASPEEVGFQRVAFSVQLRRASKEGKVSLNMEAPVIPEPPKGWRLYVDTEAYYALSHKERKGLDGEKIFRKVFVAEGPQKDLVSWWATGRVRKALVRAWEKLGGGLEVSSQGVLFGVILSRAPESRAIREHIEAFAELVFQLSSLKNSSGNGSLSVR